jgi:flagellin-like protein
MLRRILKQKRYFKNIYKEQKGITGLETAIILIAFVVVAAVFAYTVLSAGLFSSQKAQESVYNGLKETQNTLEVKGAVLAEAIKFKDSADSLTTFTAAGTEATNTLETSVIHEGTGSIKAVTTADADTGDLMTVSAAAGPVVAIGDTVTFWAKTDGALNASFALATTATISGGDDTLALNYAGTGWHQYTLTATAAGTMFYGVYATGACVTETYYIDDIEVNNASVWQSTDAWSPYATTVILVIALPLGGASYDLTCGTTQTGGVFTGTKSNKLVVNFNDSASHISDVYWTKTFIGNNNNDDMLDPGEKVQLNISLEAANAIAKIAVNHQFTLELKSPKGAILSLQRTLPGRLYGINNLN